MDLVEAKAELDAARERIGKSSWQVKKHRLDVVQSRLKLVELANK